METSRMDGVRIILESKEGKFLLQHRDDKPGISQPGKITIFGGAIEDNESPREAAARELKEELELDVAPEDLIEISELEAPKGKVFVFYLSGVEKKALNLHEGQAIIEMEREDLENLNLSERSKDILKKFLNR